MATLPADALKIIDGHGPHLSDMSAARLSRMTAASYNWWARRVAPLDTRSQMKPAICSRGASSTAPFITPWSVRPSAGCPNAAG